MSAQTAEQTGNYVSCPVCGDEEKDIQGRLRLLRTLCTAVAFTMPLLWDLHPYVQLALASIVQFGPGMYFYKGALRSLKEHMPGMDFLVAVSTSVIYVYSLTTALTVHSEIKLYFLGGCVLQCFILFGKYLETTSRYEATAAIRKLICLQPQTVRVLRDGQKIECSLENINRNDIVLISAGERIGVDGVVQKGSILVDESMLTGESIPIAKEKGSLVSCGTLCREGEASLTITALGSETLLQRIIDIVANAQSEKSPVTRLADRISTYFVPCVLMAAAGVFAFHLIQESDAAGAVYRACSLLVISCPCALGLATPVAIMVGTSRAAELGVLFRDGSGLENMHRVNAVVFDKTGTLTYGSADDISRSNELREGSRETVEFLKARGCEVWMLSGDRESIACKVAERCGIPAGNVVAEVHPEDKSNLIRRLQSEGKFVAMVGDGINDAPALACADVAIAMAGGTEIAIESAGIVLMGSRISALKSVFAVSEATMRVIRQNLVWSLFYNIVSIPLAACGIVNPSVAAAVMSLSSNGVLFNSLRLKKAGKKKT